MADEPTTPNTDDLMFWVMELQPGRMVATDPVCRKIMARVDRLARPMFRKFPRVGRFIQVEDVVQNCLIRLMNAYRTVRPASRRHFYALTRELIRRELLDLTKHYFGPLGHGTNLSEVAVGEGERECPPVDRAPDSADLERTTAVHEAIGRLPVEEREAIGLMYYHEWTQVDIAALFKVSVRTVQRRQESGLALLRQTFPPDE
jgi:RNA polymerase sigma factor (sigma-70 family)